MKYLAQRENNVEYLKTVIAQRQIVIEECEREKSEKQKQIDKHQNELEMLNQKLTDQQIASSNEITNLKIMIRELETDQDTLKHEKSQLEFELNVTIRKNQQLVKEHQQQVGTLKHQFEAQRESLNMKISKLQKNLEALNSHYQIDQKINEDRRRIIEDANRELRGFANEKQQRMIILQNQQLGNQIQFQSKQITSLLQKTQRQQQEIKQYKGDLELHKNIENNLVKRSSLAQSLIKQLNRRIKELEHQIQDLAQGQMKSEVSRAQHSEISKIAESFSNEEHNKQGEDMIAKLKFELANVKNYNHYLENLQEVQNQKYQTLGEIMAQYLQNLLYSKKNDPSEQQLQGTVSQLKIDLNSLKQKDLKQWKAEETQIVLNLLISQIKPFLSKKSLTNFPEVKNINVSFIEDQNKEPLSLPKIVSEYEKSYEKEAKKSNRFKDIPIDISTKILRSNLRQWGRKIPFGKNIPRSKKEKSRSILFQKEKSIF